MYLLYTKTAAMKGFLFIIALLCCAVSQGQRSTVGIFPDNSGIGNPKIQGASSYTLDQHYILKGAGYNIWFNKDEFHYTYTKIKGDFLLTANMKLTGEGKNAHRKIGWMVRASTDADAAHVSATVHGDGLSVLQWRRLRGAYMRDPEDEIFATKSKAEIVQLERIGKTYIMRMAHAGEPLQEVGRTEAVDIQDEALAGLFICSHDPDILEEGEAWNVRIEKTVPEKYDGYRDGILSSRLELLDVFTSERKLIYTSPERFEAPNWMPDGKNLLFNKGGSIYKISIDGGTPEKISTGEADRNNNDHVISFDGKWLGISHHRNGLPGGGSTVYYLPIAGGTPLLVTDSTPSYLHGWNPNGKELVYTAQRTSRSAAYNIYKKSINGGEEVPLTNLKAGLADGPEYSPDGKYIYYNSTETGTMQIWRMKPDGSAKEQITFDEYNNWFPHISPDGKWMLILSFPTSVAPGDHPFYKKVMLRLMPVNGGPLKVVAYLFGGQGTINTPSWSPDSKRVAFVSNSKE